MSLPFAPRNRTYEPKYRLNGKIRAREVRVIGPDNQQVGILTLSDAIRMAQHQGVDLVEIAPTATPPVCRLVNYGKFRYEEAKKQKKSSESGQQQLKEIQLRPGIAVHDLETKLNHAREFLLAGAQVKVAMRFRGRELRHPELGVKIVGKFIADLAECGRADAPPKLQERNIHVMLRPLSRQQRGKAAAPKPEVPQTGNPEAVAPAPPAL